MKKKTKFLISTVLLSSQMTFGEKNLNSLINTDFSRIWEIFDESKPKQEVVGLKNEVSLDNFFSEYFGFIIKDNGNIDFFNKKTIGTTSVENLIDDEYLEVYPNPSSNSDLLTIHFKNNKPNTSLKLVDIYGKTIKEFKTIEETKGEVFVKENLNLPAGIYFVILSQNDKSYTKRINILQ